MKASFSSFRKRGPVAWIIKDFQE